MANIDINVNSGETKTLTFNTGGTYTPEDLIFSITGGDSGKCIYSESAILSSNQTSYGGKKYIIYRIYDDNITSYTNGLIILAKFSAPFDNVHNDGIAIEINSLGSKLVYLDGNSEFDGDFIQTNKYYILVYNGSNFNIVTAPDYTPKFKDSTVTKTTNTITTVIKGKGNRTYGTLTTDGTINTLAFTVDSASANTDHYVFLKAGSSGITFSQTLTVTLNVGGTNKAIMYMEDLEGLSVPAGKGVELSLIAGTSIPSLTFGGLFK